MSRAHKIALANHIIAIQQRLCGNLKPTASLNPALEFEHIAIFSTTALGDLMFNTPAIRQLRRRYPRAELTLIASAKYRGLFDDYVDIDHVVYWDSKFRSLFALAATLRRLQIDLAVSLHTREPYDVMAAAFSGCAYIVKDNYGSGSVGLERWLASYVENFSGHIIQRKLNVLLPLGCRSDEVDMVAPCKVDRERYAVAGRERIGFQLGASTPERRWPVENFVELARLLLASRETAQIVLLGMPQEKDLEREFLAQLGPTEPGQVVSLLGKTTIRQAFDAIASLDLLVTGDTGPLHLAVALKIRSVSLFVTANPGATGPYQDPALHTILHCPLDGSASEAVRANPMRNITPDLVFPQVVRALDNAQRH